ncbi:hypothetical protein [Limosilactobacillus gastricus]|nr:hypothetical protein [Limosilactobacillus gastricus]
MSIPLLKQSIKANFATWAIVTLILNILLGQLLSMDMAALVNQMYYNMLMPSVISIYIIITGNKLLANQVDRGSMAYILSAPIRRTTVVTTQAIYFIGSLAATFLTTTGTFMMVNNMADTGFANDVIVYLNLGAFMVSLALAGIMFAASGIFNLSKNVMGTGGLLVLAFLIIAIVGSFADFGVPDLKPMQHFTILSLFDIKNILAGGSDWIPKMAVLGGIGLGTITLGGLSFVKKDLPL